jgi:hypothetical protein
MKKTHRLKAKIMENINAPGFYCGGDGLYLQVGKGAAKSWIYRYILAGNRRESRNCCSSCNGPQPTILRGDTGASADHG